MTEDKKNNFNKQKTNLEESIKNLLENKDLKDIKDNINKIISSKSQNDSNKNEKFEKDLHSLYSKIDNNLNKDNCVYVIKELLLYYSDELLDSVFKSIFDIEYKTNNNNNIDDDNELLSIVKNLRNIIKDNDEKIESLINDYVKKPLEISKNNQQSSNDYNYIENVQSNMIDAFKDKFSCFIEKNEDENDLFYSCYLEYLNESTTKEILNNNKELSTEEIHFIKEMLCGNLLDSKSPFGLKEEQLSANNGGGHYVLCFNKRDKIDDSISSGVQTNNCCGVYFAHMYYIAEMIYNNYINMINNKTKFDFNIFITIYDKFRKIYISNARQNDNLDTMKKINCKNRLCIFARESLDQLDGYISKEAYYKLLNEIKKEIRESFITKNMEKEFDNLNNNIEIELKKVEDIENINENKINKLITMGETSNKKIIESILIENNKSEIIKDENFTKAVLPNINVGGKNYSGFNGDADYNEKEKVFNIKYNQGGFFDTKLSLMNNFNDDEFKNNLKQGLKFKLKETQNNEKLLEIFTLLKTNPVLALLELNDISEEIYLGDKKIENDGKIFDELVNTFAVISESRRQIIKLDNIIKTKEKNNETRTDETVYNEIEVYICKFLKEALMNNEKAEEMFKLTEFKDMNIIIDQVLELFKKTESEDKINNKNQGTLKEKLLKTFKSNDNKENIKLTSFMNYFNGFVNSKLKKIEESIDKIHDSKNLGSSAQSI